MISVVVATKNRPHHLTQLLKELKSQTVMPFEVIVVDASDNYVEIKIPELPFKLKHLVTKDSSTARQRNLGISQISKKSKYLSILDDDTIPEVEYFQKLVDFLEVNNSVIGASGVTFPGNEYLWRWHPIRCFKSIFFLDSHRTGVITRGGINIGVRSRLVNPIQVEWLIGCCIFKVEYLKNLEYQKSFDGYSLGEDVLFSYEASKFGELFLVPNAQINHLEVSKSEHYQENYWYKWSKNRKSLIRTLDKPPSKWVYYHWSNLGQILILLLNPKISSRTKARSIAKIVEGTFNA